MYVCDPIVTRQFGIGSSSKVNLQLSGVMVSEMRDGVCAEMEVAVRRANMVSDLSMMAQLYQILEWKMVCAIEESGRALRDTPPCCAKARVEDGAPGSGCWEKGLTVLGRAETFGVLRLRSG